MNPYLRILVIALGGVSLLHASSERPTVPEVVRPTTAFQNAYYVVHGRLSRELRAQINQYGPCDAAGNRHWAYTAWRVDSLFTTRTTPAGVVVDGVEVKVAVVRTLPQWPASADDPPELRTQWESFVSALAIHEDGHTEIAKRAAAELLSALLELKPAPDEASLRQCADAAKRHIFERAHGEEADYDRSTDHGRTQGAVLR